MKKYLTTLDIIQDKILIACDKHKILKGRGISYSDPEMLFLYAQADILELEFLRLVSLN